jgi:hypothetical protein
MKKEFARILLTTVSVGAILVGCTGKEGDPDPAITNLPSNIEGFVNPVDENGGAIDKRGVTVTLDNITPAASVTTDTDGHYEFKNIPKGTYNFI